MGSVAGRLWRWVRVAWPIGPAPVDETALVRPVHLPMVNGRLVTIEVIRINGQDAPGQSLANAIRTFSKYVSGQVRVVEHEPVRLEPDRDGQLSQEQLAVVIAGRRHRTPSDLPVLLAPAITQMRYAGTCRRREDGTSSVLMDAARMRAGRLRVLSRELRWQRVLLHEMAHALWVPADRSHIGRGTHCTWPDCVMYSPLDHRAALKALLRRRLPMDLCPQCQREIRAAQEAAGGRLIDPEEPYDRMGIAEAVVQANPGHFAAYTDRAALYSDRGEYERAIADYTTAIELNPKDALAWSNRGITFARKGDLEGAIENQNRAVELQPDSAYRYRVRAGVLMQAGQLRAAVADLERCLARVPNDVMALNKLAWVLATCKEDGIRDGVRAMELARKACDLDGGRQSVTLDALAAACAEAGRFDEAITHEERAIALSEGNAAEPYRQRLELYRAGKAYRE